MIYRRQGFVGSEVVPVETELKPFDYIAKLIALEIDDIVYSSKEKLENFKKTNAPYFNSGELIANENGDYINNGANLLYRDLIAVDMDDIEVEQTEAISMLTESLKGYKYIIYNTIKHTEKNPRLRLILEPSRKILKDEYLPTLDAVQTLVPFRLDTNAMKWQQLAGLPVYREGTEVLFIKRLEGKPFDVVDAPPAKPKVKAENEVIQYSEQDALKLFKNYIELEKDNLQERNDYYLSVIMVLAKSVVTKEISNGIALKCCKLLAFDNTEWIDGNIKLLDDEINRSNGNVDYFTTEYTFKSKFNRTSNKIATTNLLTNAKLNIITDEKGKVIQTLQNLENIVLSMLPIAYNELTEVIEIINNNQIKPLDKRDKELLRLDIERKYNFKAKIVDLETAIVGASEKVRYHPIKTKIKATTWDGVARAESFFIDVLGVEDNFYNRECSRKWLLASIKRLFKPGTKFDEMIILHGGQGLGKSTTLQKLSLGYYTDITEKVDKELTLKVIRSWLIELSELSTMKKTDDDTFKAWLSTTKDTVRRPYAIEPTDELRQFTILGTTNNKEILKDRTGNRRYWLMYCEKDRIKTPIWKISEEYILQLWSEVYTWYKANETLLISEDTRQYMERLSRGAVEYDPLEEKILKLLDIYLPNNWENYFNEPNSRFKLHNYVSDFLNFGIENNNYPPQQQITEITTNELLFLIGDSGEYSDNLKGNRTAKEINKIMNTVPNWKKDGNIKRNGNRNRGYKRIK